ncbi:DUF3576 domain-containing protein [Roseomonas indoligenes]|uniref:DUF3576 domain-containing protein n=1 Tax=Roseomonas indoligenes TaxID=2820811 RepID=A0A940S8P1_9PROT|nr:DUF3576 domain-containing protein [Pararoseomonas indoligenes]MBP0494307.1 DUF3576 domain-containing protein [Pararoseomonas indoligenes]
MRHLRLAILALPVLVAACGNSRQVQNDEYYDDSRRARVAGRLSGNPDGLLILGTDRSSNREGGGAGAPGDGSALGVNAYLWRASLDTLSFMPLASADPFGGVIITDWYSPPAAQGERFRATAYILGRQLRSDGVRVSIFRQEMRNGQWVDAPVSAGTSTELEDKVLARARELRSQSAAL